MLDTQAATPLLAVVRAQLDRLLGRYDAVVERLPEEALNWRPGDEETNSVAQLVRHITAAQEAMVGRALGEPVAYDHRRSLRNDPATRAELRELVAGARARKEGQLDRLAALDLGELIPGLGDQPVPRCLFVVRLTEHASEHIGHAELTAQLWAGRGGA